MVHGFHELSRIKKFHEEYGPRIRRVPDKFRRRPNTVSRLPGGEAGIRRKPDTVALINLVLDFKDYQVYRNNGVLLILDVFLHSCNSCNSWTRFFLQF